MVKIEVLKEQKVINSYEFYKQIGMHRGMYPRWLYTRVIKDGAKTVDYFEIGTHIKRKGPKTQEVLLSLDFAKGLCQAAATKEAVELRKWLLTV